MTYREGEERRERKDERREKRVGKKCLPVDTSRENVHVASQGLDQWGYRC